MPLSLITEQPAIGLAWIVAILVALSIHEFAHAAVSTALGDTTARNAGRLTVNPLAHIDVLGFLALLLIGFGWGKPVPFDPGNLAPQRRRWGPACIALAGPTMNLLGLVVAGSALGAIQRSSLLPQNNLLVLALAFFFHINLVLLLFNLIPIPPLDGSKVLLGILDHPRYDSLRFFLETRGPMLLLSLLVIDSVFGGAILGRLFHAALQWTAGVF